MILKKTNSRLSVVNGRIPVVKSGHGVQRKSTEPSDHWGFLEEIEAPMWVDLTIEVESMNHDIDEMWFQTAHQVHQCSSRQLISTFSVSGDGNSNSNSNSEVYGPLSPKLPSSVSRSRGNHYKSRKWGKSSHVALTDKKHPIRVLGGKTSVVDSGASKELKPTARSGNSECTMTLKPSFVCESSSTGCIRANDLEIISGSGGSKGMSSSKTSSAAESNLTSATRSNSSKISFVSGDLKASIEEHNMHQRQTSTLVTRRTSGFLSAMRMSQRTKGITRLPSRVEIKDGRQSKGRRSSSSKSSMGSSNTGCDLKNMLHATTKMKDKTPDGKNIVRTAQPANYKGNASNISKTSTMQVLHKNFKSKYEGETFTAKSAHQGALKSQVLYRTLRTKALAAHDCNVKNPLNDVTRAKERTGIMRLNKMVVGSGKVNALRSIVSGQKSSGKENAVGSLLQHHNTIKHHTVVKDDVTRLSGPKGKVNGRSQGKNPATIVQRTFFR